MKKLLLIPLLVLTLGACGNEQKLGRKGQWIDLNPGEKLRIEMSNTFYFIYYSNEYYKETKYMAACNSGITEIYVSYIYGNDAIQDYYCGSGVSYAITHV